MKLKCFALSLAVSMAVLLISVPALVLAENKQEWKPVGDTLLSKFAGDVNPDAVHQEYPRPQMKREAWKNLNGRWQYAITPVVSEGQPDYKTCLQLIEKAPQKDAIPAMQGKILVPFAIESALSGVGKTVGKENYLWYETSFEVPAKWNGKHILLHFGAVDWQTIILVNGKEVGRHRGGYTPFTLDVTDALTGQGTQKLVLRIWDPTTDGPQPIGKQHKDPHGIWYTPVTGIWQTVWIEPVESTWISRVLPVADIDAKKLTLTVSANGTSNASKIKVEGKTASFKDGKAIVVLDVPNAELWSPSHPKLYPINVELLNDNKVVDSVESYYAMRKISLGKTKDGITRMMLNNEFLFQQGPLDQGWWPDGLYTAPTDEALKYDLIITQQLGFNMLRKHVKVEPARFYYHCDTMGMLVWQDMPSGDTACYIPPSAKEDAKRTPESIAAYEMEYKELIENFCMYPSIIMWVPFNEGWGQFDTKRIVDWTKKLDPSRLVNCASGWTDRACGDVYDKHSYPGPSMFPTEENRATVLGEYGGLGFPIKGHLWKEKGRNWGYVSFENNEKLFQKYNSLNRKMHGLIGNGLSAAVYTQTTDVEIEVNGLMTYDRKIIKMPVEKVAASNKRLHEPPPTTRTILPTAETNANIWKYTFEKPNENWTKVEFDDSGWKKGEAGFGTKLTPGTTVRTEWNTSDIWIRRSIEFTDKDLVNPELIYMSIYHDEDAEIYINGIKVAAFEKHASYSQEEFDSIALKKAVKVGKNNISVHCHQTNGGQYIDLGIFCEVPVK